MMFSRDDFRIESPTELFELAPIALFIGLVAPFLLAAYTLGFIMDLRGWLETDS